MHIPDGYIGPITWAFFWIVMIPIWFYAGKRLNQDLSSKRIPLLAIGAAFSFLIMMFNIPVFGGSTGHAVGGTLIAIILGPWEALIAVSVALIIQALFFGDGGITAIGANCFNIAFVLPFVGYGIYRLIAKGADAQSNRHWIGAAVGSYIAITVAAILTGFELGLQTILYPAEGGQYPYFMYPISVAVTIMAIEHLILFGFIEGIITALVVRYIQTHDPNLLNISTIQSKIAMEVHS